MVVTWYDVLGILPGASADRVREAYDDKAVLLSPERLTTVVPDVAEAAARGRELLDNAWLILRDPGTRERYDQQIGVRRKEPGLSRPGPEPSGPALDLRESALTDAAGAAGGQAALAWLAMLADWLTPLPRRSRRVIVPDVRGLCFEPCCDVAGRADLRVSAVQLTEHPLPVEGLVVGQSPAPGVKARRSSVLTVRVWHPPRP